MLKFGTFNILDSEYAYFNNKLCVKKKVTSDNDETLRNSVIIKIIENNNFDILFLQEASKQFLNLLDKSELGNKHNIIIQRDLVILLNKVYFGNPETVNNLLYTAT